MIADLVLRGGRVFTGGAPAEAVAIAGDRIVAAGTARDVRALEGSRTRVVDLRGRMALAGFHDAHTHLLGAGLVQGELSLLDARSPEECARKARAAAGSPAEWLIGRGWDPDVFPERAWPHRA